MANARKKDVIFVDATGDITVDAVKPILWGVLITPSAANSRLVIKESSSTGTTVVDAKIEAVETRFLDLSGMGGIELTTTFNITTLTNMTSVMLYGDWVQNVGVARGTGRNKV